MSTQSRQRIPATRPATIEGQTIHDIQTQSTFEMEIWQHQESENEQLTMAGIAIITEACVDTKDRACVDVCPVQCIYEFVPSTGSLVSEEKAGSGIVESTHIADTDSAAIFGDSVLYVNLDECTSCTACYQPDVCPVGAIYSDEHVPDGTANGPKYNKTDPYKGHDHTFFIQLSRDVFAD